VRLRSGRLAPARVGGLAAILIFLLTAAFAAQTAPAQKPQMAEDVYLNVQVLRGIPVDRFNDTMGMFSSALLLDCVGCHAPQITSDPKAFAVATPRIQRARQMVLMMNAINKSYFGGQQRVTCFTCHGGDPQPERSPSLRLQYGELVEDPTSFKFFPSVNAPPPEKTLARYLDALGGAGRLAKITTVVAKGTYTGFDTSEQEVPVEVFARAPDQRAMVAHAPGADLIWTFDGRSAWRYQPDTPIPLIELTGWNITGARLDAMAFFPAGLQKAFSEWQASIADVDGKRLQVVRGANAGQTPVNMYFDEGGLLVRMTRWTETAAGPVPVQTDLTDYRDVAGVKMPFRFVVTWTNGQSTVQLSDVQVNVPIDAARFSRPQLTQSRR
jgi:outer membrane lipoprotein-sorting protein